MRDDQLKDLLHDLQLLHGFDEALAAAWLPSHARVAGLFERKVVRLNDGLKELVNDYLARRKALVKHADPVKAAELFYRGVCDAWNAAAERARARYASDRATADAVIARNAQQRTELESQKRTARMIRNIAFGIAATALMAFLIIALFLAFLAMEGHSKALREAVETLAAQNPQSSRGGRP